MWVNLLGAQSKDFVPDFQVFTNGLIPRLYLIIHTQEVSMPRTFIPFVSHQVVVLSQHRIVSLGFIDMEMKMKLEKT